MEISMQDMGSKSMDISTPYSHKFYEDLKLDLQCGLITQNNYQRKLFLIPRTLVV